MSRTTFAAIAASLGVLVAMPASAHHSRAAIFDANKPVEIHGVVVEIRLENPHSWFYVEATDADGKVVRWGFEASTPTSLIRSGYKPGSIKVGDEVIVKGSRARDLTKYMAAPRSITLKKDGRSFIVGPAGNDPC